MCQEICWTYKPSNSPKVEGAKQTGQLLVPDPSGQADRLRREKAKLWQVWCGQRGWSMVVFGGFSHNGKNKAKQAR